MDVSVPTPETDLEKLMRASSSLAEAADSIRAALCLRNAHLEHPKHGSAETILHMPPPLVARADSGGISLAHITAASAQRCPYLEALYLNPDRALRCPFLASNGAHALDPTSAAEARASAARLAADRAAADASGTREE